MSLSIAAEALNTRLVGGDALFTGVSTDTRSLDQGDLFVALRGPHFDGHHFLANAMDAGAVGALLDHSLTTPIPYIEVANTTKALGQLATFWRDQFDIPVVAITGSNGKTTVKEMLTAILAEQGVGCSTQGTLNNHIGVPLTILRLRKNDHFLVVEMGMNHKGEIDYLSKLTKPTIAVINNAAQAHLEGVGTIQGVAEAKAEVFNGLSDEGLMVINADDPFAQLWRQAAGLRRVHTFGLKQKADITATYQSTGSGLLIKLRTAEGDIDMKVPLLGKHNVMNTLAASSAALMAGASLKEIKSGMEKLKQMSGRLEVKEGINGASILDDTYNANPDSLAAGIQVLKEYDGERVLIIGDMAELGDAAADIHKRVGDLAKQIGISRLFALGPMTKKTVKRFGKNGKHYSNHQSMIEALHDCMHTDMTILIKGSRTMHMERIVEGITKQQKKTKSKQKSKQK